MAGDGSHRVVRCPTALPIPAGRNELDLHVTGDPGQAAEVLAATAALALD
jgi:hypothetical protein